MSYLLDFVFIIYNKKGKQITTKLQFECVTIKIFSTIPKILQDVYIPRKWCTESTTVSTETMSRSLISGRIQSKEFLYLRSKSS